MWHRRASHGVRLLALAVVGACGSSESAGPSTSVAAITIVVSPSSVRAGDSVSFRARLLDGAGNELRNREVSWSSSDPALLSIAGTSDSVVAEASAVGGPVTATASSEGQSGSVSLTIVPAFVAVSVGSNRACGVANDGFAWCWGRYESGTEYPFPVQVAGTVTFALIAVGNQGVLLG